MTININLCFLGENMKFLKCRDNIRKIVQLVCFHKHLSIKQIDTKTHKPASLHKCGIINNSNNQLVERVDRRITFKFNMSSFPFLAKLLLDELCIFFTHKHNFHNLLFSIWDRGMTNNQNNILTFLFNHSCIYLFTLLSYSICCIL